MGTLDYQPKLEKPKPNVPPRLSPGPPLLMAAFFFAGGWAALKQDFIWFAQMESPEFGWGPGQYIYGLMESIALLGGGLITMGAVLVLVALRRSRR